MTCEATRNGELFCTNPARFITLVCPVCRQRFDLATAPRTTHEPQPDDLLGGGVA